MLEDQRVDQARTCASSGRDLLAQWGSSMRKPLHFFGEGPVAQPDICNGEGTPSEGPPNFSRPPISVFYSDFGHFILQI